MSQQLEREKIQVSSQCAADSRAATSTTTTRIRTTRESIEIERSEQRRRQMLDQANSTIATSPGGNGGCVATAARDSSSPPLTLIDANVARQASASLSDKSQRRQPTTRTPSTTPSAGKLAIESEAAADKLATFDKDKFFKQQQDELNNNSIHVAQNYCLSSQQQHQNQEQIQKQLQQSQMQPAKSFQSQSIKQTQSQPPISPLNLLSGLRMHTNNLRNAQQQLGGKISNTTTTSSPVSFVESSLNPRNDDDEDVGSNNIDRRTNISKQTSRPLQGINIIPSYTSIFDKPRANHPGTATPSTSATSENRSQKQLANTSQRSDSVDAIREPIITKTTTATRTTSRSPSRKQAATFDSLSSSRTLLTTISSIGNKSHRQDRNDFKKLPSVYDYSGSQLRRPIDYDNQSRSQADFDLEAGSSVGQSQTDGEENADDDDDDDDCELDVIEDEKSPFSGRDIPKQASRSRATLIDAADDRKRAQEPRQANNKFAGSATRLNHFMKPKESSARRIMSSSSSKKSLAGQQPQAQHTRISMADINRPPSFDTTTCQQHDQAKAASCRKLDLLEQMAHLECHCHICLKNKKLSNLHDHLYHHQSTKGLNGKISKFDSNSAKSVEKNYPKTRVCHMVLKSIILVLCTLLLLLLLVSAILLSHYLPQSMDKVMNASRSFNVTIAGRR